MDCAYLVLGGGLLTDLIDGRYDGFHVGRRGFGQLRVGDYLHEDKELSLGETA